MPRQSIIEGPHAGNPVAEWRMTHMMLKMITLMMILLDGRGSHRQLQDVVDVVIWLNPSRYEGMSTTDLEELDTWCRHNPEQTDVIRRWGPIVQLTRAGRTQEDIPSDLTGDHYTRNDFIETLMLYSNTVAEINAGTLVHRAQSPEVFPTNGPTQASGPTTAQQALWDELQRQIQEDTARFEEEVGEGPQGLTELACRLRDMAPIQESRTPSPRDQLELNEERRDRPESQFITLEQARREAEEMDLPPLRGQDMIANFLRWLSTPRGRRR